MDNLKICKSLNDTDLILNIPSKLFISVIVFFIVVCFVLKSFIFAPGLCITVIAILYKIYKDDPQALQIWKRVLFRNYTFVQAGKAKQTKIIIRR